MNKIYYLALNAADHLVSKGRLDAAASILQNYLSTNDPQAKVMQRLGRIYLAQGRSAEAVTLLQQALECFQEASPDSALSDSAQPTASEVDPGVTQTNVDTTFIATH